MKVIGIDIGGTKTSIGIINTKSGKISQNVEFPSKSFNHDNDNLEKIICTAKDLAKKNSINLIGIGVPELIDNQGIVRGSYNFNWDKLNFKKCFSRNMKVFVDSDVRNHLRAEKFFGHGIRHKNFAYINIGSGISYAQLINNKIYNGYRGYAIHFGSSLLNLYDIKTKQSYSQIPEDHYSGKSIVENIEKMKTKNEKLFYFNQVAFSLASIIGNLINTIDPEFIVLGGGVVLNNKLFTKNLIKHSRDFIIALDAKKMKFHISKLKKNTGLIGAGLLHREII